MQKIAHLIVKIYINSLLIKFQGPKNDQKPVSRFEQKKKMNVCLIIPFCSIEGLLGVKCHKMVGR